MTELDKAIKTLAKVLAEEVTEKIKRDIRQSQERDVEAIVKDCLNKDQVYQASGTGFLPIEAIVEKYKMQRNAISRKCRLFNIERKKVGRRNLINEAQFLEACQNPSPKPIFIKD